MTYISIKIVCDGSKCEDHIFCVNSKKLLSLPSKDKMKVS